MKVSALAVFAISVSGAALAQEMHQHEAHVHGRGALDIAFEGDAILMELRAPGADIVGFEHPAEEVEDKAAVGLALNLLSNPGDLFVPNAEAGCDFVAAEAELHGEEGEDEDHDHAAHDEHEAHDDHAAHDDHDDHDDHEKADDDHAHDEHATAHDAHDEHEHDEHDHDAHEAGGHSEFHAEFVLSCKHIDRLDSISLNYFKAFDGAEALEVQAISDKGSFGTELTREAPVLELKGRI